MRTLSLFFLLMFLSGFVIRKNIKIKEKPYLIIDKNFDKKLIQKINKRDFKKHLLKEEKELIEFLKRIHNTEIYYAGPFDYENKRKIFEILMRNKIIFNYFYSQNFKNLPFKVSPFYLLRKDKKEGFKIEGKNLKIKIFENDNLVKEIFLKKDYFYIPEFIPNKTRRIIFTSNGFEKSLYVTDIDEKLKIKIYSPYFHPVIGFLKRFFENYLNSDIEIEVSGKIINKLNLKDYDFYVNVFENIPNSPSIFIPLPDTFLEGEFEFPFELSSEIDRIEIKKTGEENTLYNLKVNGKDFPLILKKDKNLMITSPDLWKINLVSEREFEKKFLEIIKKHFLKNIPPKVIPLFSKREKEGELILSFYIKSFDRIPDMITFFINEKKLNLKRGTENIFETSLLNLKKGKYVIKIFDKEFNLEIIPEKKEKEIFYDLSSLETAREITGGKKIDIEREFRVSLKEREIKKTVISTENFLFLLLFTLFYLTEIYLRKRRGLI